MAADIKHVEKIVTAGMKIAYSPQGRKMLIGGMQSNKTTAQKLALEVVGLIRILYDKSKSKMPPNAIPAATVMLIYELADFFKQSGEKVGLEDVKEAIVSAMKLLNMVFEKEINGAKAKQQPTQPTPMQAPQGGGLMGMGA